MLLSAVVGQFSPGVLVVLGMCVFGGMAGAWFFQKIHFPQVVGYIAIGLLLGDTGFGLVHAGDVENLKLLNLFALGIIGFLVGGELHLDMFKKYGKEFIIILFGEGVVCCLLVAVLSYIVIFLITANVAASLAAAIVFGAIASATDPASTIDVIWEYRAKGIMTTAIIAIVALDDALALTLYGIGTSSAQLLVSSSGSVLESLKVVGIEIFGAIGLGAMFAFTLIGFLRYQAQSDRAVALSIGVILLVIGVASYYDLDVILSAMMVGFILSNFAPRRSQEIFKLLRSFSIPIYVLFFVFVGARLNIWQMPQWLWLVALVYVVGRSLGKWAGSWLGAKFAGSAPTVRKYLGIGIFAQGGVAIGLSIVAAENLKSVQISENMNLGDMIVYVITATTLVVQFLGPAMVKVALKKSGEAERDVTIEDVMKDMTVVQAMTVTNDMLVENMPLSLAFKRFREQELLVYPVAGVDGTVKGILSFDALKNVAADYSAWEWMLVADAMLPLTNFTTPEQPLDKLFELMAAEKIDQMVVVDSAENMRGLGILDRRTILIRVENEQLVRSGEQLEAEVV